MTAPARPPRRILIGACSYADARTALELARQLRALSQAEIGGLMVEETLLGDLPRLARQRIVTERGTLVSAPSAAQVRQIIESDARAFQAALTAIAQESRPLERRRGDLALAMWESANGWDVLVYGHRATHGLTGRVALIVPPEGLGSEAARYAEDLAQAMHTTTVALALGSTGGAASVEPCATEDALLRRISRLNCAAVVLDRSAGPFRTVDQLRHILAAARCPVVVLGKTMAGQEPEVSPSGP